MKLTVKNYQEATKGIDFSKLPQAAQEAHKEFSSFADFYNEDKDIKEMLDNHFKIVEPYLDAPKRASKTAKAKATTTKKTAPKKKAKASPKTKPTSREKAMPKQAKRKANEVDVMPMEIRIIRRYISMDNKKVSERQVSLLYKAIQRAAIEKTIRKTSKYADEIKKIGNDLAQTYKQMNDTCTFEVPQALHSKLKTIVDSYGVTPAVALIKRFIGLYNNITEAKAQRLLTSINNAIKSGKVKSSEKEYKHIKTVQDHLKTYLDSDKLLVTDVQLNGLKGLAGLGK